MPAPFDDQPDEGLLADEEALTHAPDADDNYFGESVPVGSDAAASWEVELGVDGAHLTEVETRQAQSQARAVAERAQSREWDLQKALVSKLVAEARVGVKRRSDEWGEIGTAAWNRWAGGSDDSCVWCCVNPPRGKTMLCQACTVYRRKYGVPPPEAVISRRRASIPPG
jgi:hypothetical protein